MDNYSTDMTPLEEIRWCADRAKELLATISEEYRIARESERETRRIQRKAEVKPRQNRSETECEYCGAIGVYARGFCKNCYCRFLRYGTPERRERPKKAEPEKIIIPWEEKLFFDVVGGEETPPDDLMESVVVAVKLLKPREAQIVFLRYRDRKTIRQISEIVLVSPQRISQIISKSIRDLRAPSRLLYFTLGRSKMKKEKEMADKKARELFEARRALIGTICSARNSAISSTKDIGIEFLNPSVRSYNCLKRAGIDTISQLLDYIGSDRDQGELNLMRIRNLGRKSVEEITVKIDRFFATYGGSVDAR